MDNIKMNKKKGGGGHKGCQFGCFASKFGRDLDVTNQPKAKAFTLAEVLITLVIIGVVAALTIPSVVISYKKHKTVTQLKKAYTTLSQATNMAIKDHGPIQNWEIEDGKTKEFVEKYIVPYLKIIKNCGYDTTDDNCKFEGANLKTPNSPSPFGSNFYKIILPDGISVYFKTTIDGNKAYTSVYIDVNGQNAPNVYGKDLFWYLYWVKNPTWAGKFAPNGMGRTRDQYLRSCDKEKDGYCCAGLIMLDGWQMKNDYPW